MREETLTIVNRLGLHARAANKFVSLAKGYASEVRLAKDGNAVDGKSIMAVLLLAAPLGSSVTLQITGPDENEAFLALTELINNRFGEAE